MVLNFIEYLMEKTGTFVGMRLDKDSKDRIAKYQQDNKINNPVSGDELHVTVVYSRKIMPNIKVSGKLEAPYIATISNFDIYNGVLVGILECPALEFRHTDMLNRYKGTHDYDSYSPHVSFSYEFDGDVDKLPPFEGDILFVSEYTESLN